MNCHSLVSDRDNALKVVKLSILSVVTIFNSVSSHQRLVRSQHRAKDSVHFHKRVQTISLTLFETLASFEIFGLKSSGERTALNHSGMQANKGKSNYTRT